MNDTTLDMAALRVLTDGDAAFEKTLLTHFEQTAKRCLQALQEEPENETGWQQATHELKGAAANLQARKLAALCKQAESATGAQRENVVAAVAAEVACVVESFKRQLRQ